MKPTRILHLLIVLAALIFSMPAFAQDTNTPPATPEPKTLWSDWSAGVLSATNWTVAPYATFAPNADTKWGGGMLAMYNISPYVGAGIGVDWLGRFTMTSGNITVKVPLQPLAKIGISNSVTPFAIAGIGIPMGGAEEDLHTPSVITGGGVTVQLLQKEHWDLGAGYAASYWTEAGPQTGLHHQIFLALHIRL